MAVYLLGDTETASLQGGVVEVAWLWLNQHLDILDMQCHRVNPERPIEPGARAIHGISDEMVADCPTIAQVMAGFTKPVDIIGHNIAFDIKVLKAVLPIKRRLCTLSLSRQYTKGTTNHKLETLQREIPLPEQKSHSALGDILTCRDFLLYTLPKTGTDLEGLFQRAENPRLVTHMPFGRYEGMPMMEVPQGYRYWLSTQELDQDLSYTLKKLQGL